LGKLFHRLTNLKPTASQKFGWRLFWAKFCKFLILLTLLLFKIVRVPEENSA